MHFICREGLKNFRVKITGEAFTITGDAFTIIRDIQKRVFCVLNRSLKFKGFSNISNNSLFRILVFITHNTESGFFSISANSIK